MSILLFKRYYVRNFNGNDLSRIVVEYRDAANTSVLDSYDSGNVDNFGSWLLLSDTRNAPSGTRHIRIRLISTRVSGSNNDGYYDNLSLTTNQVLPVELIDFEVKNIDNDAILNWQTATEINNSHFDVKWSKDGISFEKIGEVAGAGTTNEVQFYDFLHESPVNGENYYRLCQVDFDGKFERTDIIIVTITQSHNFTFDIFPNPAAHYLKIESEDLIGELVQIFSVNGQLVKEFQHQSLITDLSINDLSNGIYFVKAGEQVEKLIIQK